MAYTTEDRDALKAAIASGVRVVRYADRTVEFRSLAEMLRALDAIEAELLPRNKGGRKYVSCSSGVRN